MKIKEWVGIGNKLNISKRIVVAGKIIVDIYTTDIGANVTEVYYSRYFD